MTADALFWTAAALAGYAYAGYPLLARWMARRHGRTPVRGDARPALTVVIAARNEASRIGARLRNLLDSDYPAEALQVLLVDDGSDDGTAAIARAVPDARIRVLELPRAGGKAAALNAGMAQVRTPFTVFADARQRFGRGTLGELIAPFADPGVGVVSGELRFASPGGDADPVASEGTYGHIERRLREDEARLGWAHAASGAIYAIRTHVFRPLPPGLLLDDVFTPVQALRQGLRIWVARDAVALDQPGTDLQREFRRKLRTLAGNWQLIAAQPWLMRPGANPAFFAWVSHKVLRLLAPWALLTALVASAFAATWPVHLAFWLQLAAYGVAVVTLLAPRAMRRVPLAATAGSFVTLNAAAFLSLPVYLGSRDLARLWKA
jgi:cellulose synthase/poly-beta-1,6-N-acetylglucosamine synthase-like glycosyltransferase